VLRPWVMAELELAEGDSDRFLKEEEERAEQASAAARRRQESSANQTRLEGEMRNAHAATEEAGRNAAAAKVGQ